jgi:hypothetical protein
MHARDLPPTDGASRVVLVRPWVDPVIDQVGHDPRSAYVERFWLGVLGPSVTWFLRYLADRLDAAPDGFDLDLDACAWALGLGNLQGPNAAFPRTITRSCQFGAARALGGTTLEVRRKLPPLNLRQLGRLPAELRDEHARWVDGVPPGAGKRVVGRPPGRPGAAAGPGDGPPADGPPADELRDRARQLALSMLELGEGREVTERQLHRWRFHPAMASEATDWALARHAEKQAAAEGAAGPGGSAGGDDPPPAATALPAPRAESDDGDDRPARAATG